MNLAPNLSTLSLKLVQPHTTEFLALFNYIIAIPSVCIQFPVVYLLMNDTAQIGLFEQIVQRIHSLPFIRNKVQVKSTKIRELGHRSSCIKVVENSSPKVLLK